MKNDLFSEKAASPAPSSPSPPKKKKKWGVGNEFIDMWQKVKVHSTNTLFFHQKRKERKNSGDSFD